jgi:hypothetical protein
MRSFGHHPDPAIDFCVEVDIIEGLTFDAAHGMADRKAVEDRIFSAMQFTVGGDERAVAAKQRLRVADDYLSGRVSSEAGGRKE